MPNQRANCIPRTKIHDTQRLLLEVLRNKDYSIKTDHSEFSSSNGLQEQIANNYKILDNNVHKSQHNMTIHQYF